ncbi:MAG: glycosyltransferase family 2 protein, partial [Methanobacteriota archaeon]
MPSGSFTQLNTPSLSFGIPKFSVLINSRDRLPILYRCLESVLTQDYPDLEILVLDDASTRYHLGDRLSAVFKDPRLHCFRVETPLGVAGGRNFLMQ